MHFFWFHPEDSLRNFDIFFFISVILFSVIKVPYPDVTGAKNCCNAHIHVVKKIIFYEWMVVPNYFLTSCSDNPSFSKKQICSTGTGWSCIHRNFLEIWACFLWLHFILSVTCMTALFKGCWNCDAQFYNH